jgi:hypothetical protein
VVAVAIVVVVVVRVHENLPFEDVKRACAHRGRTLGWGLVRPRCRPRPPFNSADELTGS